MLVYLRDGSALTNCTCCHTEMEVADQTFYLTHSTLTSDQPVPALTLWCQAPGRGATGVPILSHWYDSTGGKKHGKQTRVCRSRFVCLLVGCFTSQQQASVSQGRICSDNFTCCHTEIQVADQTFYLTQAQYTDTGPTSPSADPITPGAWQGSYWSANF